MNKPTYTRTEPRRPRKKTSPAVVTSGTGRSRGLNGSAPVSSVEPVNASTSIPITKRANRFRSAEQAALPESPAARMLAILEAASEFAEPFGAIDLVPRLGLPRATVHRLAVTLERLGYLHREPGSKRFTIGFRQQRLAINSLINSSTRGARHSILQALVRDVGETCNVTILDGNEIVYIDRVESDWPLRTHLQPGSRVPLHCGASGMLFLSLMPAGKRRKLLTSAPLKAYTDKTVTDPKRIEGRLRTVKTSRIAVEAEEFMKGLIGLAVPVYDERGRICATVSMHAPTARFTVDEVLAQAPALKRAAEAISGLTTSK